MMDIGARLSDQAQSGDGVITVDLARHMQCSPADLHEIPVAVAKAEGIISVNLGGGFHTACRINKIGFDDRRI